MQSVWHASNVSTYRRLMPVNALQLNNLVRSSPLSPSLLPSSPRRLFQLFGCLSPFFLHLRCRLLLISLCSSSCFVFSELLYLFSRPSECLTLFLLYLFHTISTFAFSIFLRSPPLCLSSFTFLLMFPSFLILLVLLHHLLSPPSSLRSTFRFSVFSSYFYV